MEKNMNLKDVLKSKKIIADGGFGTYYSQLTRSVDTMSEKANLSNPQIVKQIHKDYIHAGARLIRTNTFSANQEMLQGDEKLCEKIIKQGFVLATEAAQEAKQEFGIEEEIYVAADIGPIPGDAFETHSHIFQQYQQIIDQFLTMKADIFVFETFPDLKYLIPLANYIKSKNPEAFILTQFCLNRYGYTKTGFGAQRLFQLASTEGGIDCVGFNCGIGSGHMYDILKKMTPVTRQYISIMPNSGYPEMIQDRKVYLDSSKYFANKLKAISGLGVSILGGCCGTNPRYIRELKKIINLEQNIKEVKEVDINTVLEIESSSEFNRKLRNGEKVIAVELDPPFDANEDKVMESANRLKASGIDILTFADSPMGRGRVDSILMSLKVKNEVDIPVMPHLACRDKNAIAMRAGILGGYMNAIRNLLLVTGDPIPSSDRRDISGVFDFNSVKLMELIQEMNVEHFAKDPICYGGALNYGRYNIDVEVEKTVKKIQAGATYFLSQPIFTKEDVDKIRYIKSRVDTKILCGIMPLVSYRNASFIRNEITGIHVPMDIVNQFSQEMSREEGEAVGIRLSKEIIKECQDVADGFYIMLPFNRDYLGIELIKYIKE